MGSPCNSDQRASAPWAHLEAAAAQGGDAAIVNIGSVWAVEAATTHGAITSRVNF
jgi:hypothetical protein